MSLLSKNELRFLTKLTLKFAGQIQNITTSFNSKTTKMSVFSRTWSTTTFESISNITFSTPSILKIYLIVQSKHVNCGTIWFTKITRSAWRKRKTYIGGLSWEAPIKKASRNDKWKTKATSSGKHVS